MDIKIYIPHPALEEYVISILTIDVTLPEGLSEVVTPYPPTPFQSLMFYCNDSVSTSRVEKEAFQRSPITVLTGPQFSRVNIKVHKRLRSVRVDFLPGGMYRLLGVPMHELFDEGYDARDFFGPGMGIVNDRLQQISSLEEGKNIVEEFLLHRVNAFKIRDVLPFDSVMHLLVKHSGNMTIEQMASLSCLSIKQFERKCKENIGMNPKTYTRILRFSKAYRLREAFPQLSWIEIAYRAGYYDQMHMIRDFKVFAGVNPSVIEQELVFTPLRFQKDIGC